MEVARRLLVLTSVWSAFCLLETKAQGPTLLDYQDIKCPDGSFLCVHSGECCNPLSHFCSEIANKCEKGPMIKMPPDLSSNLTDLSSKVTDLSSNLTDLSSKLTEDLSSKLTDLSSKVMDLSSNLTACYKRSQQLEGHVRNIQAELRDVKQLKADKTGMEIPWWITVPLWLTMATVIIVPLVLGIMWLRHRKPQLYNGVPQECPDVSKRDYCNQAHKETRSYNVVSQDESQANDSEPVTTRRLSSLQLREDN